MCCCKNVQNYNFCLLHIVCIKIDKSFLNWSKFFVEQQSFVKSAVVMLKNVMKFWNYADKVILKIVDEPMMLYFEYFPKFTKKEIFQQKVCQSTILLWECKVKIWIQIPIIYNQRARLCNFILDRNFFCLKIRHIV